MINIYDVRPVNGHVAWEQFLGSLSEIFGRIEDEDKPNTVIMCRDLPDEWQDQFSALGTAEKEVAWVRFDAPDGHFHYAFIAWDQKVLIDYVNHVGEEIMGGEATSFIEQTPPTIH